MEDLFNYSEAVGQGAEFIGYHKSNGSRTADWYAV